MILIENATVIKEPLTGKFSDQVSVLIDSGAVMAVGEPVSLRTQFAEARRVDGDGCLLLPGLIDAHTHLYAALTTGMPGPSQPPRDFP
jgi:imidazolonepropionase-like amidohydrolase